MKKIFLIVAFVPFLLSIDLYGQSTCLACELVMAKRGTELKAEMNKANKQNKSVLDDALDAVDFTDINSIIEEANTGHKDKNLDLFTDKVWELETKAKNFPKSFNEKYKDQTDLRILAGFTWLDYSVFEAYVYTGFMLKGKKVYYNIRTGLPMILNYRKDTVGRDSVDYQIFKSYEALALHTSSDLQELCKGHHERFIMDDMVQKWDRKFLKENGKRVHYITIEVKKIEVEEVEEVEPTKNEITSVVHKEYYDNGKLKASGQHDKDKIKTGIWKFYYKNGKLKKTGQYDAQGKATGEWKYYNENGKIWLVGKYIDAKKTGKWRSYHENGQLKSEEVYHEGKLLKKYHIVIENDTENTFTTVVHYKEKSTGKWTTKKESLVPGEKITGLITDNRLFYYWAQGKIERENHFRQMVTGDKELYYKGKYKYLAKKVSFLNANYGDKLLVKLSDREFHDLVFFNDVSVTNKSRYRMKVVVAYKRYPEDRAYTYSTKYVDPWNKKRICDVMNSRVYYIHVSYPKRKTTPAGNYKIRINAKDLLFSKEKFSDEHIGVHHTITY